MRPYINTGGAGPSGGGAIRGGASTCEGHLPRRYRGAAGGGGGGVWGVCVLGWGAGGQGLGREGGDLGQDVGQRLAGCGVGDLRGGCGAGFRAGGGAYRSRAATPGVFSSDPTITTERDPPGPPLTTLQ